MKLSNQGKRVIPSCQHPANSSAAQITGMAITSHTTHPSSFFNHLPPFHFIGKGRPKRAALGKLKARLGQFDNGFSVNFRDPACYRHDPLTAISAAYIGHIGECAATGQTADGHTR